MSVVRKENLVLIKDSLSVLLSSEEHGLRDRQHEALLKLAASQDSRLYEGYFNHATGAGKTFQMSTLIRAFRSVDKSQKIIILEASVEKVRDMADDLTNPEAPEFIGEGTDVVGMFNKDHKDSDKPVIVATYASLKNLMKQIDVNRVALVMPDEAHRGLSEARRESIKSFPNACVYGFTASPKYDEVRNLDNLLKNQIDELPIAEAIAKGLNCSFKNILLVSDVDVDLTKVKKTNKGDFDDKEFDKAIRASHNKEIKDLLVDFWVNFKDSDTGERACDRMTMINCRNMNEAREQAQAFNDYFGVDIAKAYGSDMSDREREETLTDFEAGKFPIICQVDTLGEAYDNKKLSLCINYPTASIVRETQRGGRPLRLDPENKNKKAWVLDLVFRHPEFKNAPVTVAAEKNGQILYAHIAGGLDITSPDRKIFEEIIKNKMDALDTKTDLMDLSGFKIISETEELLNIEREYIRWRKDNIIPIKTEFMRSSADLNDLYIGNVGKIAKKLKENLYKTVEIRGKNIPIIIEAMSKKGKAVYLNGIGHKEIDDIILNQFTKLSKLQRKDTALYKTDFMLNARELSDKHYHASPDTIIKKLRESLGVNFKLNNKMHPLAVEASGEAGKGGIYLNCSGDEKIDSIIIDEFAKLNGLKKRDRAKEKTEHMIAARFLDNVYRGGVGKITKKLQENLNSFIEVDNKKVPVVIEASSSRGFATYLNATGDKKIDKLILDEFTKLSGLTLKNSKTKLMKNLKDLSGIYVGDRRKIIAKLKENLNTFIEVDGNKYPLAVETKSQKGKSIFLNGIGDEKVDNAIVDEFTKVSELKRHDSIIRKNEFMKNSDELADKFVASETRISSKLKENLNSFVEINDKKYPLVVKGVSTGKPGIYLNAIGDKEVDDAIFKEFTKITKFELKDHSVYKNEFMKSPSELSDDFIENSEKISFKLRENFNNYVKVDNKKYPVAIDGRTKYGNKAAYLNGVGDEKVDDAIMQEFIKRSKLRKKDSLTLKTEFMKSPNELNSVYVGTVVKIKCELLKNKDAVIDVGDNEYPIVIEGVASNGVEGIYLNGTGDKKIDTLISNEFTKRSGLKLQPQSNNNNNNHNRNDGR